MTHQDSWDADSYRVLHKQHHYEPDKFKWECTGSGWDGEIHPSNHHGDIDIFRKIILNQWAVRIREASLNNWAVLCRYIHAAAPTWYLKHIRKEKSNYQHQKFISFISSALANDTYQTKRIKLLRQEKCSCDVSSQTNDTISSLCSLSVFFFN